MKNYTVLLRRSQAIADEWPNDTYTAKVKADTARDAVEAARIEAVKADTAEGETVSWADYQMIIVFEGHPEISLFWFQAY